MRRLRIVAVSLLLWVAAGVAAAKEAAPLIADPVIEARMTHLTSQLRCLVCQGQSIAESDSGFAHDVRNEINTLMRQGKSDQEILDFLVQRYGDFILFKPPVKATTVLLWVGPPALLLIGAATLLIVLRRQSKGEVTLSAEDLRRAEALLQDEVRQEEKS